MFSGLSRLADRVGDFLFGRPEPEPKKELWESYPTALNFLRIMEDIKSGGNSKRAEDIEPERQAALSQVSRIADKGYKHIRQTEKGIQQELGEVSNQQNGLNQQLNKCSQLEAATSNIEDRFKTLLQILDANRQN